MAHEVKRAERVLMIPETVVAVAVLMTLGEILSQLITRPETLKYEKQNKISISEY